jgi:RimJ/RimL family protein N-acetyltransferase
MTPEILADRVRLRAGSHTDRAPFAALNADPRAVEHFVSTLSRERSDALARECEEAFDRYSFNFWAVDDPGGDVRRFHWTLRSALSGALRPASRSVGVCPRTTGDRACATEGARAALRFGFRTLQLGEIAATTVPRKVRSRPGMEKIGTSTTRSRTSTIHWCRIVVTCFYRLSNPELL